MAEKSDQSQKLGDAAKNSRDASTRTLRAAQGDGQSCVAASKAHCFFIPETKYVMAGWACGECRVYNGVWRDRCKECQHRRCITIAPDVLERQQRIRAQLGYTDDTPAHNDEARLSGDNNRA